MTSTGKKERHLFFMGKLNFAPFWILSSQILVVSLTVASVEAAAVAPAETRPRISETEEVVDEAPSGLNGLGRHRLGAA